MEKKCSYLMGEICKSNWYKNIWWLHYYWWLFCQDIPFQGASNMIKTCDSIFARQHKQTRKILITSCKYSNDRYHLIKLRLITIIYHIYIECEWYNLAYIKNLFWSMNMDWWVQQWVGGMIMIHSENNYYWGFWLYVEL